jgi:hypothetical protein
MCTTIEMILLKLVFIIFSFNNSLAERNLNQHDQIFQNFFQQYKIQGNCQTVFVTLRKTSLSQFLNSNSYGNCHMPVAVESCEKKICCDLKHRCTNQIIDAIEPFSNLDKFLLGVII